MAPPTPQTPTKRRQPAPRSPGTPRRRKYPAAIRLQGVKPDPLTAAQIKEKLIKRLKLAFEPDQWQVEIISRIRQGYDSIFTAGTGYGKSLIFEGLAALGGKNKKLVVVTPIKALERDQVKQANEKGIEAIMINEDNTHDASIWKAARTTAQLVYISPEMALSNSFTKLWKDSSFRTRLQALVIDEAHCIDEWGEEFRPLYRELSNLRTYTGQEVPFVACTATCSTKTFDIIWDSLGYGHRPEWGVDVGCDRPNLLFLTRALKNTANPVLDALNILPPVIDSSTPRDRIDKAILYFSSEGACRLAVQTLRKVLPAHLRDCVQPFSSDLSEEGKALTWDKFKNGSIRILCATDAAGMGCNIPDIRYSVVFGLPKSLSVLSQRWGRTARDRQLLGTCLLLVPEWAFRPKPPPVPAVPLAVQLVKGHQKEKVEPKRWTTQRAALDSPVESFVNAADESKCSHQILTSTFRPETRLTTYSSLSGECLVQRGSRSERSAHELSWTVLDLGRTVPPDRCCNNCNPHLLTPLLPSQSNDPRLSAYANEFVYPLARPTSPNSSPPSRPVSVASTATNSTNFEPGKGKQTVSKDEKERLRSMLHDWLEQRHASRGSSVFISRNFDLPPKQMQKLVMSCGEFLTASTVSKKEILKLIKLDLANDSDFDDLARVITEWREKVPISRSPPRSQRRVSKRPRQEPLEQPQFSTPNRPPLLPTPNENVFFSPPQPPQTPHAVPQTPRTLALHATAGPSSFNATPRPWQYAPQYQYPYPYLTPLPTPYVQQYPISSYPMHTTMTPIPGPAFYGHPSQQLTNRFTQSRSSLSTNNHVAR